MFDIQIIYSLVSNCQIINRNLNTPIRDQIIKLSNYQIVKLTYSFVNAYQPTNYFLMVNFTAGWGCCPPMVSSEYFLTRPK